MDAVLSRKQVGSGRFSIPAVVGVFAVGLALGALAVLAIDSLPSDSSGAQVQSAPKAYHVEQAGEGRLAGQLPVAAVRVTAHDQAGMGEGLLAHSVVLPAASIKAHHSVGMGEGWLSDSVSFPVAVVKAYPALGQGEGWVGNGRPADTFPVNSSIGERARAQ